MSSPNRPSAFLLSLLVRLQRDRQSQQGYTLVVTIALVLILSALLITYAVMSRINSASSTASAKSNTGFYTAEAGLNLRAKEIRNRFEGFNAPIGTSPANWQACIDADSANNGSGDFQCRTEAFENSSPQDAFARQIGVQEAITYVDHNPGQNPVSVTIPTGETFAGLNAQEFRYDVISVARDLQSLPTAILGMRFKSRVIPLFQFAAFYEQDLDIPIPPNMTLNGPVHSNSDLYLDAATGNTLAINGQVTAANKLYRGRKDVNQCNGTVTIRDPGAAVAMACGGGRQEYTQADLSPWNNQVRVGIPRLEVPQPDTLDPQPDKLYWKNADLRIVLKLDGAGNPDATSPIEVWSRSRTRDSGATNALVGNTCAAATTTLTNRPSDGVATYAVSDTAIGIAALSGFNPGDAVVIGSDYDANVIQSTAATPNALQLYKQLGSTPTAGLAVRKLPVWTSKTFYNYREKNGGSGREAGRFIRMLNVDVGGLMNCAATLMGKPLNDTSDGGLVWHFTVEGPNANTDVTSAGSPNEYGIRLYNGREFNAAIKGLTIVSDQAIYLQGDYNSINKKPAAIMADTVNILSNAWSLDDGKSYRYAGGVQATPTYITSTVYGTASNRVASNTTINAAFLAGIDITGGVNQGGQDSGNSGGGLNNYPRLHEDWTGKDLNYLGSLVSLGSPRRVNGSFCGSGSTNSECNIYNPPIRNWNYDTSFSNAANLPPLTPRAVYLKQELFSREFEQAALPLKLWTKSAFVGVVPTLQIQHSLFQF